MKKLIFVFLVIFILLSSCATWHENWAYDNGFIKAEDCIKCPELPPREALPKPVMPIFDIDPETVTEGQLINTIIELFGTVRKFQFLVEIYEREYLNAGGKILPEVTLEELKLKYRESIGDIDEILEEQPIIPEDGTTGTTAPSIEEELTVEEFESIINMLNLESIIYNERGDD